MGGYSVDAAQLRECDALLGSAAGQARAVLAQLQVHASELFGTWHGSAGAAFRLAWERWLEGATSMVDALDEMAVALGGSGVDYAATEDAVRTSFAGTAQ